MSNESITGKGTNEQLVVRIQAGEDVAENMLALWQQNKGFINKLALKYSGYAEIDDLRQEGYLGLCEAVYHYDIGVGIPFINYAAFWIKQVMQRYIENHSSIVRIPVGLQNDIRKYKKIKGEYLKYYGCEPTNKEMRSFLGVSIEKLEQIQNVAQMANVRSLSEPIGEEEDCNLGELVASGEDIEEDAIKRLDAANMKKELWVEVGTLPDSLAKVIRYRYKDDMTFKEIGQQLGIEFERVRSMEAKAMRTLRSPQKIKKFRRYFEQYISAAPIRHIGVETFQRTWTSSTEWAAIEKCGM